jgi:hypothetical protein
MRLVNVNHIFAARNVQEVYLDQGIKAVAYWMTYLLAADQCAARLSSSTLSESAVALTLSSWIL